ncbi:MAG: hypothetical protein KY453_02800 [Gemmatimonadetes bacterium]|nr:hypothetical protein [Gemmatimonadota bacterium]
MAPVTSISDPDRPRFANRIRVVAQALIQHGSRVLVQEGHDPALAQHCAYHRLPGGEVAFTNVNDAHERDRAESLLRGASDA